MPLVQGIHMDPKLLETEVTMVLDLGPPEIQAPGTLSESQGSKIFVSKISSHHPEMMLFYAFWGFVMRKMLKKGKGGHFQHISPLQSRTVKLGCFSHF